VPAPTGSAAAPRSAENLAGAVPVPGGRVVRVARVAGWSGWHA